FAKPRSSAIAAPTPATAVHLEPNLGQFGTGVLFEGAAGGSRIVVGGADKPLTVSSTAGRPGMGVELVDANPNSVPFGIDRLPRVSNYLLGTPNTWRTGVASFGRVTFPDIYPDTSMAVGQEGDALGYSFTLAPGTS